MEQENKRFFNSTEEVISMILGLLIVIVLGALILNFIQKRKGNVEVPGISSNNLTPTITETTKTGISPMPTKKAIAKNSSKRVPPTTVKKPVNDVNVNLKPGSNNEKSYTIKKGDSLWKIAMTEYGNGDKWLDIARANKISKPGLIHSGNQIIIPQTEGSVASNKITPPVINKSAPAISTGEYTVVKGDNLWTIAVRAYGDGYKWTEIWKSNKKIVKNPGMLTSGMKLAIPFINNKS